MDHDAHAQPHINEVQLKEIIYSSKINFITAATDVLAQAKAMALDLTQDATELLEYYQQLAATGQAQGQYIMGWLYGKGFLVEKNSLQRFHYSKLAAQQNYPPAQFSSGLCYFYGIGTTKNINRGIRDFLMSATQSYAVAQTKMGSLYCLGSGVEQSSAKSLEWFECAIKQGLPSAYSQLGWMYYTGSGVPEDKLKAEDYLNVGAQAGDIAAQFILGTYWIGSSSAKRVAKGIELIQLSALGNFRIAQYKMGELYETGEHFPKDNAEAKCWYTLASEQGHTKAKEALQRLE